MFSIGMFSKINKITTKTLRYYEDIGLLKPEYVDEFTKYRYYTTEQLPKLHQIITLKQMGLSLAEIKKAVENPEEVENILMNKEKEMLDVIKSEEYKIIKLRNYLTNLKGEVNMNDVIIKSLPKVKVASMRKVLKGYDELFNLFPNVMAEEMMKTECTCAVPDYCFNIYHDGEYRETDMDVEMCQAINDLKEDTDILKFKELDAVENAVCILHNGPYSTLGKTYADAFKWIEDNKYKVVGNPRESYIDGIWNKESEEDWLTEVQIPVKRIL
ncbi:TPA: MerR family transcriptional regulator [Clostridioides difficile]|nr:MerR family transcriptional regulator [Clostridioides difficile]